MGELWETQRYEAEKLIRKYKFYHMGTAAGVGAFGGQFGVDRIPLTMLTVTMIGKICSIYNITDIEPVALHTVSAIIRLTYRGTLIGMGLNWLPGGSLVNGFVTYSLTGQAGRECIQDIENNRMNNIQQVILAFGRSAVDFACEGLELLSDKLGLKLAGTLRDLLNTEVPLDGVQTLVSHSVLGTMESILSGNGIPGIKEFLLRNIPGEIAMRKFTDVLKGRGFYVEDRAALIRRLNFMRTNKPVFSEFDKMIDGYINRIHRIPDAEGLKSIAVLLDQEFSFLREAYPTRQSMT